ncbi:unnamed protein product [Polarella glacialis]|uniref:MHYT domain-containing protein n=1 Tax=Polarella glacialis TaxID=89957 RepID=A0A813KF36_POLGL|nr:unnamed protein product [Polarella glacialis]CAE8700286.1 unnamed protein product [Polarella glacialis]
MTVLLEYLDGEEILQRWDASFICLSLLTAWTGAYASLTITDHLKFCTDRFWYVVFIILAGLAIGVNTVWCMHFVGMQALYLDGGMTSGARGTMTIKFEITFTLISAFAAWLICSVALHILSGRKAEDCHKIDRQMVVRLVLAAALIAVGVVVMHFMGMLSQSGNFDMEYNGWIVLATSLFAAVAAVVVATIFSSPFLPPTTLTRVIAAAVVSAGVNCMHYCGMAASTYRVNLRTDVIFVPGSEALEINGLCIAIIALWNNYFLSTVCDHYVCGKIKRDKRELAVKSKVQAGLKLVTEMPCPLFLVSAEDFLSMPEEELRSLHEGLRPTGKLLTLDTMDDVLEFKKTSRIFFFSYEWLSWGKVGPNKLQLSAMKTAADNIAKQLQVPTSQIHIWIDILSIPQRHAGMKAMAVDSLYAFAHCADIMVIIAPDCWHEDTGVKADALSYSERVWTRVEQLAHCSQHGVASMFIQTAETFRQLPDGWMETVCTVLDGHMTCCRNKHPNGCRCDKQTLVIPLLALYHNIYKQNLSGYPSEAAKFIWDLIQKKGKDQVFPPNILIARDTGITEVHELFGDTINRIEKIVVDENTDLVWSPTISFIQPVICRGGAVPERPALGRHRLSAWPERPGQIGRCDGYSLEGEELNFYKRKLEKKTKA